MATFKLVSCDGEIVDISERALQQSVMLRQMLQETHGDAEAAIPVHNVDGPTTRRVVKWCEAHKLDPLPEVESRDVGPRPAPPTFEMPRWDREFFAELSIADVAKLVMAANYLEITWLYKFCCKHIFAEYIKDRPVEELRTIFESREAVSSLP
uniref:Skp1-related protein n=1 Tax=Steinernema glaseri TaxID=37863 RepID=A0A1I8ARS2_9BILA